jgi:hypothetical protein
MSVRAIKATCSFSDYLLDFQLQQAWAGGCATARLVTPDLGTAQPGQAFTASLWVDGVEVPQFTGYIDTITHQRASGLYTIEGRDVLRRAVEYFMIVDQDHVGEYQTQGLDFAQEISALLTLAGITTYARSDFGYIFVEGYDFGLQSVWDAISAICQVGQWRVYADAAGQVYISSAQVTVPATISATLTDNQDCGEINFTRSTSEVVNRVVVIGSGDVWAEAVDAASALPWTKTAVIGREWFDDQTQAQAIADLNLNLYKTIKPTVQVQVWGGADLWVGQGITLVENLSPAIGYGDDWVIYSLNRRVSNNGLETNLVLKQ